MKILRMNNLHTNPNYIFTSFLTISRLFISKKSSEVKILGYYGNLLDGSIENIIVLTDFESLNGLLTEADEIAEYAINQISDFLSGPSEDQGLIDLSGEKNLHFSNLLFAFVLSEDEEEEKNIMETEEVIYTLIGCLTRGEILPEFTEFVNPRNTGERLAHLNALLIMQYHFYLAFKKKLDENAAFIYANLTDPLFFNLAKTQFELQKSGQTN